MTKEFKPDPEYLALARFIMGQKVCPTCGSTEGYRIEGEQEVPKELQSELGKTIILVTCKVCGSTTNRDKW